MDGRCYAVAADGATAESQVSDQAARAPCYLLFDDTGKLRETLANPFSAAAGRAAPQAVELLAGKGADAVIAARFGHKMLSELASAGIGHAELTGSAAAAIRAFLEAGH
jgi:predicted Fe-Mo cluster-binding NifX family protein